MYLRSLTIKGFKSFARKTVLEFQPGVTIIVGPNGSGKSNIADAVMWVLGEQSPTSLRGNRMEDIIFAGSASTRPVNLAEVALTLDNTRNAFPLDYSEITVSRNVVRGGDSEYRLNNGSCRLLDIQELLSDAGVGRTLNSVISQGQLDEVLSCRPEERRDYIEEAGGLLKYRRRREKAVRRLARMEEELVRTGDVMREVRRQLRPLQRQAGRLEQYQALMRELADSQLRLDVARLRTMQHEWKQYQDVQEGWGKDLSGLDRELAEKARAAAALDELQSGWREREAGLRENLYKLVSIHERLKAMLGLWDDRGRRMFAPPPPDPGELEAAAAAASALGSRWKELEAESERLSREEAALAGRASDLNRRLNESERQAAVLEARLEVIRSSEGGLADIGPRLLAEKREALERLGREREDHLKALSALEEEVERHGARASAMEEKRARARDDAARAGEGLRAMEGEMAGLEATLDILNRLETEDWSMLNAAAALKAEDPTRGGLGGSLAESIKIVPEYEKAIMSFLGPWAFGLIARDAEAIKQAIGYLKKNGLGQSLFFRHSEKDGRAGRQKGPAPAGSMRARDLVEAPEWFDQALDTLLEGVFVVSDLESAFALTELYSGLVFLTPDGDLVSGGTMAKGGSIAVNPVHLEMTRGRREEMKKALADCRARVKSLEQELKSAGTRAEAAAAEYEAARGLLGGAETESARRSGLLASCQAHIESLTAEIVELAEAGTGGGGLHEEAEGLEEGLERQRALSGELTLELRQVEETAEEKATSRSDAASLLASCARELEAARARERGLRAVLEQEPVALDPSLESTAEVTERLRTLHARMVEQVSGRREKVRREIEEGALEAEEGARKLRDVRDEVSRLQDRHEELRDRIHGEDLSHAELKVRVEQLVERIVDGHKVPLEFALKQYPEEEPSAELEQRVEELTGELEHIGPVNPEAITERQSLEERFEFLKEQTDDIEKSKAQLKRVIRQVDRDIEEKFSKTLEEVNGHFQEIFSTLFPNGSAELRLTDPDDMLASGVEILAQPEGKRLRRISLLSGGETSLTALAFFFALFRVRPSPFYFLDEVEAALDDVNLHRFLDLVKQFKDESQLILITHQKRSMEIADILYGVTMQEDGISRVVSQKVAS